MQRTYIQLVSQLLQQNHNHSLTFWEIHLFTCVSEEMRILTAILSPLSRQLLWRSMKTGYNVNQVLLKLFLNLPLHTMLQVYLLNKSYIFTHSVIANLIFNHIIMGNKKTSNLQLTSILLQHSVASETVGKVCVVLKTQRLLSMHNDMYKYSLSGVTIKKSNCLK